MKPQLHRFWRENKSFFIFLALMFIFRSSIADWNTVPTSSMKPTIIEGDRIAVNKLAYDLRIPFTHISVYKVADPKRGEIAVFDSKVSEKRLVKRVIGVPGDRISMKNNQLTINGAVLQYEKNIDALNPGDQLEQLFDSPHIIRLSELTNYSYANFPEITVPEGFYLMLGDNRNNSADSRAIGFVPRDEFVGRSGMVVMSFNYDNFYLPRSDRFFKSL